jgi:hypothetical protein
MNTENIETLTAELAAAEAKYAEAQAADRDAQNAAEVAEYPVAGARADAYSEVAAARVALAHAKWQAADPDGYAAAMKDMADADAAVAGVRGVYMRQDTTHGVVMAGLKAVAPDLLLDVHHRISWDDDYSYPHGPEDFATCIPCLMSAMRRYLRAAGVDLAQAEDLAERAYLPASLYAVNKAARAAAAAHHPARPVPAPMEDVLRR